MTKTLFKKQPIRNWHPGGGLRFLCLNNWETSAARLAEPLVEKRKKDRIYENAITRAFELLDLTLADPRWHHRLKELVRVREVLADTIFGGHLYDAHLSDLDRYFFHFAVAARSSISTEKNIDPSSHL